MEGKKTEVIPEESIYVASQWKLMWWKFKKHKLAILGMVTLTVFYTVAFFCEFFSPYDIFQGSDYLYCPPQRIHFFNKMQGIFFRPFVYGIKQELDLQTFRRKYTEDTTAIYPVRFFFQGQKYRFWNLFESRTHFFGTEGGAVFLFGTDRLGRDLFSRTLYAARISLTVGLIGVALSFVLGIVFGGISGYFGGTFDIVIQRIIELLLSIPTIPLWMALSAALPPKWPSIRVYFGITIILSIISWAGLARVVRGKLLELRKEDFVMAARIAGATDFKIITGHLLPSFASYLIVNLTLAIPGIILGETALSFLGLGIRPPSVSWGTLLQDAQNVSAIVIQPWLLIPGIFIIMTVLAFNFLGDGLRDAADPYK